MAQRPNTGSPKRDAGMAWLDRITLGVSAGWIVFVVALFWVFPPRIQSDAGFDGLRFLMMVVVVLLPVAMILFAASAARTQRDMRDQAFRLQSAIDALRQTRVVQPAPQAPAQSAPLQRTKPSEPRASRILSQATAMSPPSLAATRELTSFELIRALNFPDTESDEDGFAALRRALRDPDARQLVQASQDVLTLLSQDGIYMDDLDVAQAPAETWRRFAQGERGAGIAALGGVMDPAPLAVTAKRKQEDAIFHDSALHFLRRFDKMMVSFAPTASDDEILAMAETRTARAFMVLARVTGTFE